MRDLVVAGGGPVGLATALYAARAGLDVEVREPRTGPVDKACGEGLMPGAVADLTSLGVPLDGVPFRGIRYLDRNHSAVADFRHGPGRGVRRTTLHAALSAAVLDARVPVVAEAVESVVQDASCVLVDGSPARHLIAADGLHSPVRRLVGLEKTFSGRRRFGLRCHANVAPWSSYVDVHWGAHAEAYVTPVASDSVGIAVLSDQRGDFESLLVGFPALRSRLDGVALTKVRGAGPLRQRTKGRVAGRVLLVGDAAGYVDALTGEGIALGLAQARAAVEAVTTGSPASYESAYRRLGRRHDLLTRGLLAASGNSVVRRGVVPAASMMPWAFGAAVDQLARPCAVAS